MAQVVAHAGEDVDQEEHSSFVGGSASLYSHYWNQIGGTSESWKSIYLKTYSWAYTHQILHPTWRTLAQLHSYQLYS